MITGKQIQLLNSFVLKMTLMVCLADQIADIEEYLEIMIYMTTNLYKNRKFLNLTGTSQILIT